MKIQVLAASLALAAVFMTSCEQHSWSETKELFSHGDKEHAHGDGHGHGHGDKAHGNGEHKDAADQGAKKEEKH
jgi:hypothetical protein